MDGFARARHVREVLRGGPAISPDEVSVWVTRGRQQVRLLVLYVVRLVGSRV